VTAVREFIKREGHHVVNKSSTKDNIFPLHQAARLGSSEVREELEFSKA
jgi:hypothetical protein